MKDKSPGSGYWRYMAEALLVTLYQKAADAGIAMAMNNLGWLYHNGWGVAQDYGKARERYQKAADAGLAKASKRSSLSGFLVASEPNEKIIAPKDKSARMQQR